MKLNEELKKLKSYMGGKNDAAFREQADYIRANFTSESDQKTIDDFIASCLKKVSDKTEELIQEAESILVREQLKDVSEIISISYIAEKYFNKKRAWIYQKINGNMKNGKPAKFTDSEIKTFNFALQDISHKIGSLAIRS
jgi:hypothetical protein